MSFPDDPIVKSEGFPPEKWKICKKCNKTLPITDFHKHAVKKDGHADYCKTCISNTAKAKRGKPLMEVFDDPPIESVGELFRDAEKEQEALELIESLFPDGIQPRQYKGMLKTIKLILKTAGQI